MTASVAASVQAKAGIDAGTGITRVESKLQGTGKIVPILDKFTVATTNIDETGDVILFGPIKGTDSLISLKFQATDLDGGTTLTFNCGLYKNPSKDGTSATAVDDDCYGTTFALGQSATTAWLDIGFETRALSTIGQRVYTDGNESAHSEPRYIGLKVVGAAATAATGTIAMWAEVVRD